MNGDTRHLELHGRQWRVVVYVPRNLRPALGKAALRRGLGTDSLKVAQVRRWAVVADLRKFISEAQAKAAGGPTADPLSHEALEWRETLNILDGIAQATDLSADLEHAHEARQHVTEAVLPRVERNHGPVKAREFAGIVEGTRTPLASHHDAFLREHRHLAKRTLGDHRRALKRLTEFTTSSGFACTVEAFSQRRTAGFFASHLAETGIDPVTANKLLSMLAGYWRWMIRKGLAPGGDPKRDNPWLGQALPIRKSHRSGGDGLDGDGGGKRPFTDEEVARLIYTSTPETALEPLLADLMKVAALSGMRIGEITELRVRDAEASTGTFRIVRAKTKAGRRTVPIHPDLLSIVDRLREGRPLEARLFTPKGAAPVLRTRGAPRNRQSEAEAYMPLSKRFGRHRERLGVHEKPVGQRQSNVDFHSFRRWFITKAEQAGVPPNIISTVVGHAEGRKGMTLGVYSAGPALDQLRACVEAVKLPARSEAAAPSGLTRMVSPLAVTHEPDHHGETGHHID